MIKGYIGKNKNDKYKPMLFSEIYTFFRDAPKRALKLFWNHLRKQEYREAIELLKKFLNIDISEDIIKDFLKEEEQLHLSSSSKKKKFQNKGFLPRELPYGANMKKRKNKKYWGYQPAEHISPTGFDNKVQIYQDLMTPIAMNIYVNEIIASKELSTEDILEELYKIWADLKTFNEGLKKGWSLKTENRVINLIKNLENNKNIKSYDNTYNNAQFQYDCVHVGNKINELHYIKDNWEEISYNEFMNNVDFEIFEDTFNNAIPKLKDDFAVMFYKSKLKNNAPVWVMKHSGIEYVFY
jgi:hypothetical protein